MDLTQLIEQRRALEVALAVHEASIRRFWPGDRPAFVIDLEELRDLEPDTGSGKPAHMTSSATCFESLADLRPGLAEQLAADVKGQPPWRSLAVAFAERVLACHPSEWTSDKAAHVYCRVRTLPAVLEFASPLGAEAAGAARARLVEAFRVIGTDRPLADRGLGERQLRPSGQPAPERPGQRYPPNSFHAYWGAKSQARYLRRAKRVGDLPPLDDRRHQARTEQNEAWAHAAIGRHTALLSAKKRRGDAQQLAFALLTDLLVNDYSVTPASGRHDLYEAALAAFFQAQEPSGRWPLSTPLFHYPESGNAYCYTFETLTELLRPALPREHGRAYRGLLEPYLDGLFRAWDYAMNTRIPLDDVGDTYGWTSTHHVGRSDPEAWATAEVFAFGQLLRCVSGHIAAERAGHELGVRRPGYAGPDKARLDLETRGRTWAEDRWTVGRQLASSFLHPAHAPRNVPIDASIRDPDAPLIDESHARSAVLYGPPGTGKTTLVEALAGALGWEYVEILASDFLSEGVDRVPARADRIFELLMQLDRCVVLFDEIDELIRDRSDQESDPFGRFLTTSMLPKIAKLWKQRRLIFFVATNHVLRADPAITRFSRFDALIFVAPPGLDVKQEILAEEVGATAPQIDISKVLKALSSDSSSRPDVSPEEEALAVLPLLRFDQVPELVRRLRESGKPQDLGVLYQALSKMRSALLHHEWQPAAEVEDWKDKSDADKLRYVYREYMDERSRDFSRKRIMRVVGGDVTVSEAFRPVLGSDGSASVGSDRFFEVPDDLAGFACENGELQLPGEALMDHGILCFDTPGDT